MKIEIFILISPINTRANGAFFLSVSNQLEISEHKG
uniref:Uncharacterized protein n=1 Tax=Rhizophora mucronata TaxID=61149 RepID=A0A2P2KQ01_RHIMU